ncbi:MAG: UDP-N-acetylmuramoyl-L-alanyl-D-glutamate--2,6-diaminopimelate ligase [Clostridia bacterium]
MKLSLIIDELKRCSCLIETINFKEIEIEKAVYDSKNIIGGELFVCIKGFVTDGHLYINEAKKNGAIAFIISEESKEIPILPTLRVRDTRKALAIISDIILDHPSQKINLIGVTGTNGKTSTTILINNILSLAGHKTGLVGTICNKIGDKKIHSEHTTPESSDLLELFAQMVKEKVDYATMEVSSHALALQRVESVEFDIAVFTNLSQDHLDFHTDMDAYLKEKLKLFINLGRGEKCRNKYAILNYDDLVYEKIISQITTKHYSYGFDASADFRAINWEIHLNGASFDLIHPKGQMHINLLLSGKFSIYNALAACAVALLEGIDEKYIIQALATSTVPGRFEPVKGVDNFAIIVDYAHTPDGLENILASAKSITKNRVITVFGCGGDRDKKKRPMMAEKAAIYSDYIIVTSDNPRTENPEKIIDDIIPGFHARNFSKFERIVDRKNAIEKAIKLAEDGDILVIAGKGHEDYQIIGKTKIPFSDIDVSESFLAERRKYND